jgi:hypothetical protein
MGRVEVIVRRRNARNDAASENRRRFASASRRSGKPARLRGVGDGLRPTKPAGKVYGEKTVADLVIENRE